MEYAPTPREAAMYAMPIHVAQQLVADRRGRYEAAAGRNRLRRFVRHAVVEAAGPQPPRGAAISLVECADAGEPARQGTPHDASIALDDVRTVA